MAYHITDKRGCFTIVDALNFHAERLAEERVAPPAQTERAAALKALAAKIYKLAQEPGTSLLLANAPTQEEVEKQRADWLAGK